MWSFRVRNKALSWEIVSHIEVAVCCSRSRGAQPRTVLQHHGEGQGGLGFESFFLIQMLANGCEAFDRTQCLQMRVTIFMEGFLVRCVA